MCVERGGRLRPECLCAEMPGDWVLYSSPGLLLQDAPLSDCTDSIDGLDLPEQVYSPARSIRKVQKQT